MRFLFAAVPGGVIVLGFTIWRFFYYGSILPNTAYAKAGGVEVISQWGVPYMMHAVEGTWFVVAWLILLSGALLDRGFFSRATAVLAITPLWCAYLMYAGGDYMPFHRLLIPLVPAIYILAAGGFAHLSARLLGNVPGLTRPALVVILTAAVTVPLFAQIPDLREREEARQANDIRDNERRQEVAEWFRENEPNALVSRNGVGVFGYYSDVTVIDALGLNDRHIAHEGNKHPEALPGHQSSDARYVLSREPDYIIVANVRPSFRFPADREIVQSPGLQKNYDLTRIELESGRRIELFRRDPEAESASAGS